MLKVMPADDHPFDALTRQYELEDSSRSPLIAKSLDALSRLPLPWPLDKAIAKLKDHLAADFSDRAKVMLETCVDEIRKHDDTIREFRQVLSEEELQRRQGIAKELLLDGIRRASNTRDIERVKRIGVILANGMTDPHCSDADEIEEMMRIAMELTDTDIKYLRELFRIEGDRVRLQERMTRHDAFTAWPQGFWGTRLSSELDSVFSKLEGFGLVSRIAPPNNLNITADFQNRYVLLSKGVRFADFIQKKAMTGA